MRFFFLSRQFKIILSVILIIIAIAVISIIVGGKISPQADILGTLVAPFRTAAANISRGVSDFVTAYTQGNEIMLENVELESEINDLREQLADYEEMARENEFYKNYLEIKDANPDFKLTPATLISRDFNDPYKSFVINRGSVNGLEENDPVITDEGLVGYISQVGLTTSKVTTILSSDITLGALDNRTNDSGIVSGALELSKDGHTKFFNLSRSSSIAIGDYVVTSGEGIFPEGLLIGEIESINSDKYNTSIFATVKPFANIDEIRNVMVINNFEGQGELFAGSGK